MAFDIDTAKPVAEVADATGFDLSTAKPADGDDPKKAYRPTPERMRKFVGKGKRETEAQEFPFTGEVVGGVATDVAAKVLPPEGAAAVGYAANVATDAVSMLVGGGVGALAKAPGLAKTLMQSALKPIWHQIESGKATRAIQTMLDEGIPATKAGVKMLRDRINDLDAQVTQMVAGSTGVVDKAEVLKSIKGTLAKFREQVTPAADLKTIREAAKEFFNHPMLRGSDKMSVQTAQALKEGTYRELGDAAYGAGLKPAAKRDTLKDLARGLKEGIEGVIPGVGPMNAKEGEMINALKILARRTGMEANKNMVGLGWLLKDPVSPTMLAWLAERSPALKSMLARGLYSGTAGEMAGAGIGAGIGISDAMGQE